MDKTEIKDKFCSRASNDLYSFVINVLGKEPGCGDDLVDVAQKLKEDENSSYDVIFQIAGELGEGDFYDTFKYMTAQYESSIKNSDNIERIEYLKEMMEYSYVKDYVVELACLYMLEDKKAKARQTIMKAAPFFDSFEEKEVFLDDIKNDTDNFRRFIREKTVNESDETAEKLKAAEATPEVSPETVDENVSVNDLDFTALEVDEKYIDNESYPEIIERKFENLIGMHSVKKQLTKLYNRLRIEKLRAEKLGVNVKNEKGLNFVLYGNPGTGKTTVARIIGDVLYRVGMLEKNQLIETDRSGLVGAYIGDTEKKTKKVLESARGCTLFIDEAYTLYREESDNDFGQEAIDIILKDMEDNRGKYCIILAGYKNQMKNMMKKANSGFSSRFDYQIEIPDYSKEELLNIIVKMAESKKYKISAKAKQTIFNRIEREKIDDTFDNARFMRRLLDSAIESQSERLAEKGTFGEQELVYLIEDDFALKNEKEEKTLDYYIDKLNSLVGLENVKLEVNDLINTSKVLLESNKRKLDIAKNVGSLHLAFTGSPGTGKTTVARLIGKIYAKLGLLKRDDVFVECGRADLVGEYQGHTATKVKDVVNSALGGVLFIDEAYNLVNDGNDTFGMEAVNTLIAEMENKRDRLAVIIAGYSNEIREFMKTNPGMSSRISRTIEFFDYSIDEMVEIFKFDIKNRGFVLSDADDEDIRRLIDSKCHAEDFGNARGVRNLCDSVIRKHNNRISDAMNAGEVSDDEIIGLTAEDFKVN